MSLPALNDQMNEIIKAFNKTFREDDYMKWLNMICGSTFPISVMEKIKEFLPRKETPKERDLLKHLNKQYVLQRKEQRKDMTCEEFKTMSNLRKNHCMFVETINILMINITEHILSGMYKQHINLCPGLYRTHIIIHINRIVRDMKTRLSVVCEIHPKYLRQLFNTRKTFKKLMIVPQRLDRHLKESTSLPDFFERRRHVLAVKGKGYEINENKKQPNTPYDKTYCLYEHKNKTINERNIDQCIELICFAFRNVNTNSSSNSDSNSDSAPVE